MPASTTHALEPSTVDRLSRSYELRRGDLIAIRQIVVMEAIATLAFGVVHRLADPTAVDPFWQRLLMSALCGVCLLLSFHSRSRAVAGFLYVLYYAYTAWAIQLVVRNDFDPNYALMALVVLASVCIGFLRFRPLLWYLAFTLCSFGVVARDFPTAIEGSISPLLYLAYLVFFSTVGYFTLRGRLQAQDKLAASRAHYALAARAANDGLWDWNLLTGRTSFSPRGQAMLGLDGSDPLTPEEWFRRIHPEDEARVREELRRHLDGESESFESEQRVLRTDGEYAWVLARGLALRDPKGRAVYLAGSLTDITDRKRTEAQLLHEALHDALTGLPNRALFLDRLGRVFGRRHRHPDADFAVLFLDLDRFKIINDSLGHAAGDELLSTMARRLQACVRQEDTVARLGGDEFAVVLAEYPGEAGLARVAARIQSEISAPVRLRDREVVTTASLGVALGPAGYDRAEDILRDADLAMYRAKGQGPGRCVVFDQAMQARTLAALDMETDLRRAIQRRELRLQYQPIVAFDSGRLTGFEALVRWERPGRGLLPPGEFIPLAEESGLIVALGRWVLFEACRQMRDWEVRAGGTDEPLALNVNVSGRQLSHPDFLDDVTGALEASGLRPENLRLELTESVLLSEPDSALAVLARLRAIGVQVHLDDFGTGYSSLSYLHRFPIDAVKIDRSFVQGMDTNPRNAAIVRTLVMLANTLGVSVLAEGVETEEELVDLREIDCPGGQGFLFAPPLDPADALELLRRSRSGAAVVASPATR